MGVAMGTEGVNSVILSIEAEERRLALCDRKKDGVASISSSVVREGDGAACKLELVGSSDSVMEGSEGAKVKV